MSLFRRKKSANSTKGRDGGNELKDVALRGQFDGLQAEIECLNERFVAMQADVQNGDNTASRSLRYSAPAPLLYLDTFRHRPPLHRRNQSPTKAARKKKVQKGVFVPRDIDFVSYDGKEAGRREISVDNIFPRHEEKTFAVPKVVTMKQQKHGGTVDFAVKMDKSDMSRPTNKKMVTHNFNNELDSSMTFVGDTGSVTESQRSIYTIKNGRKVKRIVRKVRAAAPPETLTAPRGSRCIKTGVRDEGTLKPISTVLSTAHRREQKRDVPDQQPNRIVIHDSNPIRGTKSNEKLDQSSRQKHILSRSLSETPISSGSKRSGTNPSIVEICIGEPQNLCSNRPRFKQSPQKAIKVEDTQRKFTSPPSEGMLSIRTSINGTQTASAENSKVDMLTNSDRGSKVTTKPLGLLANIQAGVKLKNIDAPNNFPSQHGVRSVERNAIKPTKSSTTTSHPATKGLFLADIQPGVKLKTVKTANAAAKYMNPSNALLDGIKAGVKLKQVDSLSTAVPDTATGYLAEIRSGVNLKKIETLPVKSSHPDNPLLEGIKAGVKLKQVDSSTTEIRDSAPGFLAEIQSGVNLKTVETPRVKSSHPGNPLLEGIKAGVKLKQVDRSLLQTPKKQETPMSALLAKIQARKEECLRRESSSLQTNEENEIDW